MATGWARVGEALAGLSPGAREARTEKLLGDMVARGINGEKLKQGIMKTGAMEGLGDALAGFGYTPEQAQAAAALGRAGLNPKQYSGALGELLQQGYRRQAVEAETQGEANKYLRGVSSGPQRTAFVQGGNIILDPYSDAPAISPTKQGRAQIETSQTRANAYAADRRDASAKRANGGSRAGSTSAKPQTRAGAEGEILAQARAAIAAGADKAQVQQRLRDRGYTKLAASL